MVRNILLIVLAIALVVTGFHFFHKARRAQQSPPPQTVADILPQKLKGVYEKQQLLAAQEKAAAAKAPHQQTTGEELTAAFESNGMDRLDIRVVNSGATAASYKLKAGTQFQSGATLVMTIEGFESEVGAGETVKASVRTVPLRTTNDQQLAACRQVVSPDSRLDPLVDAVNGGLEVVEPKVLATAALLIAQDPPLSEIASFPTMAGSRDGGVQKAPEAMQASAAQLLDALLLLKSIGADVSAVGIATDPQFKLEVLVKPDTNQAARQFFGIEDRSAHWAFWKDTILNGDPRLKHYGLYGIGRFFPEVAASMMPAWASDRRVLPTYRLSAVYALGFAGTPEARVALEALSRKFPPQTNMGRAVEESLAYLDRHAGG